ncbi:UNVERIFIED_ORG: hypothetical protein J2X79_002140 [Arthrobacter globiformis]|nr:hypothetical protein [Arthrobacter globiformis]
MNGIGQPEQALSAVAGAGTLLAAAFPGAAILHADPYNGLPYDDDLDAVYPASFPEDPFPEVLFADRRFDEGRFDDGAFHDGVFSDSAFDDGVASSAAASSGWFLPAADLTADNAGLIDQVRAYENIKCWAAGQQARLSVTFEARLRQEARCRAPLAADDLGKDRGKDGDLGAAEQIALARGESPNRGHRLLGTAKALVQMPPALAALDTGQLNEERVILFARETAALSVADRAAVGEELAADTGTFTGAGTRAITGTPGGITGIELNLVMTDRTL